MSNTTAPCAQYKNHELRLDTAGPRPLITVFRDGREIYRAIDVHHAKRWIGAMESRDRIQEEKAFEDKVSAADLLDGLRMMGEARNLSHFGG